MISWSKQYNCASWAIERLNELYGLDINVERGTEWQSKFIRFLRNYFSPSPIPIESCLVVMSGLDGTIHLGVYESSMVRHNYKENGGAGSLIASDMGTIRSKFCEVRYYVAN